MLYLLTGQIQTGKTTWLGQVVSRAREAGVGLTGFYTPAVFTTLEGTFQKTAIDCVMLPEGTRRRFGQRSDLVDAAASSEGDGASGGGAVPAADDVSCAGSAPTQDGASRAGSAPTQDGASTSCAVPAVGVGGVAPMRLHWTFDESAMAEIDARFACYDAVCPAQGLMLVDELGFLEFNAGRGLMEAMRVLDGGFYENAIATMRPALLDAARERWTSGAGGTDRVRVIEPGFDLDL